MLLTTSNCGESTSRTLFERVRQWPNETKTFSSQKANKKRIWRLCCALIIFSDTVKFRNNQLYVSFDNRDVETLKGNGRVRPSYEPRTLFVWPVHPPFVVFKPSGHDGRPQPATTIDDMWPQSWYG